MSKFKYLKQFVKSAMDDLYEDGMSGMAERLSEELAELEEMEHRMEGLDK